MARRIIELREPFGLGTVAGAGAIAVVWLYLWDLYRRHAVEAGDRAMPVRGSTGRRLAMAIITAVLVAASLIVFIDAVRGGEPLPLTGALFTAFFAFMVWRIIMEP